MSKKNKIVYSNVQPNTKEAGVWVNTTDGNVKVEKDGKWVDDGGNKNIRYYSVKWDELLSDGEIDAEFFVIANYEWYNNCRLVCAVDIYDSGDDPRIVTSAEGLSQFSSVRSFDTFKITKIAVTDWVKITSYEDYSYDTWEEGVESNYEIDFLNKYFTSITKEEFYNLKS